MAFRKDLSYWKKKEIEWAIFLLSTKLISLIELPPGKCKEYDIKIVTLEWKEWKEIKYEVKADRMAHITHNFVIETMCRGKISWIYTSEADYIVYHILWKWRIQKREELIKRIDKLEEKELVMWWDEDSEWNKTTQMWKIKCKYLPDLFTRVDVNDPTKEIE